MGKYEFDTEYDLVVVGSGASGKMAALVGAQGGLSVAILEKRAETGGTSVFAEGHAAFESSEQKKRGKTKSGVPYPTREQVFNCYIESANHMNNPDVVRMMVDNAAGTIEYLKSLGVEYYDVDGYSLYHPENELKVGHYPVGAVAAVQEILLRQCINNNVDIFTCTPAKKLLKDGDTIVGVQAEDADGNVLNIGAKAVVLATGGYGNSVEMLRKHLDYPKAAEYIEQFTGCQNTGDGSNMAIEVGADTFNMGHGNMGLIPLAHNKTLESSTNAVGSQPGLWVNPAGKRYFNEEAALDFVICAYNIIKQDGIAYSVFDSDEVEYMMTTGSDVSLGMFVVYRKPHPGLKFELDESVGDGTVFKGDTIEELAKSAGIDPAALSETVAKYNESCDNQFDPEFYKPAEYLKHPVRKGPFYAVRMSAGMLSTISSLRVNGNLQVTDENYKPIPGLYAVGQDGSGLYGAFYNLNIGGSANGFAHTSGRMAAEHILKTLGKKPVTL